MTFMCTEECAIGACSLLTCDTDDIQRFSTVWTEVLWWHIWYWCNLSHTCGWHTLLTHTSFDTWHLFFRKCWWSLVKSICSNRNKLILLNRCTSRWLLFCFSFLKVFLGHLNHLEVLHEILGLFQPFDWGIWVLRTEEMILTSWLVDQVLDTHSAITKTIVGNESGNCIARVGEHS